MGIFKSIGGSLLAVVKFGLKVAALWNDGNRPNFLESLPHIVANLYPAIDAAMEYGGMNTKDKVDSWLETLDASTGSDAGALDLVKNLPADKEEELFDALVLIARTYAYSKLKVPGYYEE